MKEKDTQEKLHHLTKFLGKQEIEELIKKRGEFIPKSKYDYDELEALLYWIDSPLYEQKI